MDNTRDGRPAQIVPLPFDPVGRYLAAEKHLSVLRALAVEFVNLDFRPMIFAQGSMDVQRIGPDPVPEQLREMLYEAYVAFKRAEYDLHEYRARHRD